MQASTEKKGAGPSQCSVSASRLFLSYSLRRGRIGRQAFPSFCLSDSVILWGSYSHSSKTLRLFCQFGGEANRLSSCLGRA